jgi:hypothetical protein
MILLAQISNQIEWPVMGSWTLGFLGVMAMLSLVLAVWIQCRKLFGKHPPISEELAAIREDFAKSEKRWGEKLDRSETKFEERIDSIMRVIEEDKRAVNERFRETSLDKQRSVSELHEKVNKVASDVAFIRGLLTKEHNEH